ncbi:Rhomboid family protein [Planctomycetes bacterium Poly30]|uniref:Rhomboid family protein n=1 Tax=Saltatorellus ferox TaxID=2528018 RepID=A0A518ESQ9_9BACT|nr:Rhomboid family protein [Planctomycetes bacterium Poly30]
MASYDDGYGSQPRMQLALPPLTEWVKKLMIANAGIFLALFLLGFFSLGAQNAVIDFLGINPGMWRSFIPAIWQPVTYAFLHDTQGLGHLLYNMLGLFFFGTMLESMIGGRRFIFFYLTAAVVGALLQLGFMLAIGRDTATIGASGAVMGLIVAAATLQPHAQVLFIFIPLKLWVMASILVAIDVFPLLLELQRGLPPGRIAHMVHIGGAAYGFLAVKRRWIWKDPIAVIERRRAVADTERRISDDARIDQLLAKISREGLGSLSRSEKTFLNKRSARKK